jgi:putative transport protein
MNSFIIMMLILSAGSLLGSIPIGGFYLESLALLIVGMIFGHFGQVINPIFMQLGFAFFIYGVALQIGPGFIESFKRDGFKFSIIAFTVSFTGVIFVLIVGYLGGLGKGEIAGIYAGAFNSPLGLVPILGAYGQQTTQAFGAVYPFAFAVMMLFVTFIPTFARSHMTDEVELFKKDQSKKYPPTLVKCFKVVNPGLVDKSLENLNLPGLTGASVSRIFRNGKLIAPSSKIKLKTDDIVEVAGIKTVIDSIGTLFGCDGAQTIPKRSKKRFMVDRRFLITNKHVVGLPLARLMLQARFGATITRIRRGGLNIPVKPTTTLLYGDRITTVAKRSSVKELTSYLGNDIQRFGKQDLYPVFFGIVVGSLVGIIPFGGFSIGIPAGILIAGIIAGRIGKVGPIVLTISPQSNHVLKRLGLMLFMATLGTVSGSGLATSISKNGAMLFATGIASIFMGLLASFIIARIILKRNMIDVIAIVSGSIACTPALEMSNSKTGQENSAIIYAAIYPMGLLAPMVMSHLLISILGILPI